MGCRQCALRDSRRSTMDKEPVVELPQPDFTRDLFRLEGKVALIMGGRGALAQIMAATLADLGCDVSLASRHEADCVQVAAGIAGRFGRRVIGLHCDIAREEQIEEAVTQVTNQLGDIGILINNAGASWWGSLQDIPLRGWRKVVDVNLTGTSVACRHVARRMIVKGEGAIINIASV